MKKARRSEPFISRVCVYGLLGDASYAAQFINSRALFSVFSVISRRARSFMLNAVVVALSLLQNAAQQFNRNGNHLFRAISHCTPSSCDAALYHKDDIGDPIVVIRVRIHDLVALAADRRDVVNLGRDRQPNG